MNKYKLKKCPYCGSDLIFAENIDTVNIHQKLNTSSEEHIIPKSLGNDDLILEKGTICDACNNYFALNIEKPFLELESIKLLRSYHLIPSRKDKVPQLDVLFNGDIAKLKYDKHLNSFFLEINPETANKLSSTSFPRMFFSKGIDIKELENNYIVSRFLVKIFTEIYLYYELKYIQEDKSIKDDFYLIYDDKMQELMQYVRYGKIGKIYEYQITQSKEIIPYANDDFVAMIEIFLDDKKETPNGLKFRLFELEFILYIS